jgi:exodeoxyribonuclease I
MYPETHYFYDLETTGAKPKEARIMQFAGQRTDLDLNPLGEPDNFTVRVADDILPSPEAVLVTGITPQSTLEDGLTEAEFLKTFHKEIARPNTIFTGFCSEDFDDEIIRYTNYRNFHDPYEWHYGRGRTRWDVVNLIRMTRALRPEGIEWPLTDDGKPSNRLEQLTELNGLEHLNAHDALSDVSATIAITALIKTLKPKLFEHVIEGRRKLTTRLRVTPENPFIHVNYRYPSEQLHTTAVGVAVRHPDRDGVFVFDLRHNPEEFADMSAEEMAEAWTRRKDDEGVRLPVKDMYFNRSQYTAPLGVLDPASEERLGLSKAGCLENFGKLAAVREMLGNTILQADKILEERRGAGSDPDTRNVDVKLKQGFFNDADRGKLAIVRNASPDELSRLDVAFDDRRLAELLPMYKARNYPGSMTEAERNAWEEVRREKLLAGDESPSSKFFASLEEASQRTDLTDRQRQLLGELRQYAVDILPN